LIGKIEQMIYELKGFEKYVLKWIIIFESIEIFIKKLKN
jgi:hypothetical protein